MRSYFAVLQLTTDKTFCVLNTFEYIAILHNMFYVFVRLKEYFYLAYCIVPNERYFGGIPRNQYYKKDPVLSSLFNLVAVVLIYIYCVIIS
jgi:hypothetical protein